MKRFATWIVGAIFIVLIYLFIDSLIAQAPELSWSPKSLLFTGACFIPIIAANLIALVFILRRDDEKSLSRAALAILIFSLACRVIWISVFDSYQLSDFGFYLNCGADVALSGKPSDSHFCASDIGYLYWKRSASYTYPIALLFGKSLLAVKLVNVLLATIAAWIFFKAGKTIFGAKVASIGLLFFIWHPDLWYAMTLASHDVPALFWLAVFFYLCALLQRQLLSSSQSYLSLVGLSLCMGGAIFFLGIARSYHYGAILALSVYVIIHVCLLLTARKGRSGDVAVFLKQRYAGVVTGRERFKIAALHASLLLIVPLLVYLFAIRSFWAASGVHPQEDDAGFTCYLTSMDVLGENRYDEIDMWLTQCPQVGTNERTGYTIRKVLHDVTHDPHEFLLHLLRKNRVLNRVDDYLNWSTSQEHEPWDTTYGQVRRVNRTHLQEQALLVYFAHAAVLILVTLRFVLYPAVRFRLSEAIPILFSAMYYSMFLFLLETQARYEIFLIFIFSWMSAQAVLDLHRRRAGKSITESTSGTISRRSIYLGGAFLLAVTWCLFRGASSLVADSFLTLRDQSGFAEVPREEMAAAERGSPGVPPVFVRNNHKQLMLAYPTGISVEAGSIMAVQRTFAVRPNARHHLLFFLSTNEVRIAPFDRRIPWDDTAIEYLLALNGKSIAAGGLSDIGGNRYFSFYPQSGLEFSPKMTIQFILRNTTRIERVNPNRGPIVSLEYIDLQ